jgi:lipid II isoglutaminyl synthase (glutamine-hydrolysing)
MTIHLVHLYQKEMNIYGDSGNREILEWRLKKRGINVITHIVNVGDKLPEKIDILIGGGGQDSGQLIVKDDLLNKKDQLLKLVNDGTVMLLVCGMYQLFGEYFLTHDNTKIEGIGALPIKTEASNKRLIGNVILDSKFGRLYGYENHSGLTRFTNKCNSLGTVIKGAGNNGEDGLEGCIFNNVFATYLHGPVLSKNPKLADELIKRAINKYDSNFDLEQIDDSLELDARVIIEKRPR